MQPPGLCFSSIKADKIGVKIQEEEEDSKEATFGLEVGRPVVKSYKSTALPCISHLPAHILCVSMCECVRMYVFEVV